MTKQELNDAYEFFIVADRDFAQAKIYKKESSVINRIKNYMIGKDDLYMLLYDGDTVFCGFEKCKYVETDLISAIRTLRNELNQS